MPKLLLVRHGHVEGIDPERFRGRMDVPLTAEGRSQALATAKYIAARWRPVALYASPMQRCVETAREIAARCAIDTTELDELNDLDYGTWQWRTYREVRAEWPELFQRWLLAPHLVRFPQGESLQSLIARTADVIRRMLDRHANDTVVLVGHDSGLRAMLLQLLDQPISAYWHLSQAPGAVSEVDVLPHGARIISINETQHLRGEQQS